MKARHHHGARIRLTFDTEPPDFSVGPHPFATPAKAGIQPWTTAFAGVAGRHDDLLL